MRAALLSVLIPAYNEAHHISHAIASVHEAFRTLNAPAYEIVVCDNNSTDGTAELAKAAGVTVVFEAHNQISRARNTAARAAKGDWFLFIDADSRLSPTLLRATLQCIQSGRMGAGGALVAFDREDLGWHVRAGIAFWNLLSRTLRWAAGSYLFCHREAWETTGGFGEEWYAGEEIHFSRALKKWCHARELHFEIITSARVITSSRKIDSYSALKLFALIIRLARPGALKDRKRCDYWYHHRS